MLLWLDANAVFVLEYTPKSSCNVLPIFRLSKSTIFSYRWRRRNKGSNSVLGITVNTTKYINSFVFLLHFVCCSKHSPVNISKWKTINPLLTLLSFVLAPETIRKHWAGPTQSLPYGRDNSNLPTQSIICWPFGNDNSIKSLL